MPGLSLRKSGVNPVPVINRWVLPSVREGYHVEIKQLRHNALAYSIYVYSFRRDWPNSDGIYEMPKKTGRCLAYELWNHIRGLVAFTDLPDALKKLVV